MSIIGDPDDFDRLLDPDFLAPNPFARLVRQAMIDHQLNPLEADDLRKASRLTGLTFSTLQRWINGQTEIQSTDVIKFCRGLKLDDPIKEQLDQAFRQLN